MSPDEAHQLLFDLFEGAKGWVLRDLLEGHVLDGEEIREIDRAVERRVVEGEAPVEALQAPQIVNEQNRSWYEHNKAHFRREIARFGTRAVVKALEPKMREGMGKGVLSAFNDANDEIKRDLLRNVIFAPTRVLVRNPRARESRPRRTRSSCSCASPTRLAGDDPEPPLDPAGPVAG
jgi:hypothetical protein